MVPEWISVLVLLLCNVRDVFGTGMFGDARVRDETESEKETKNAKKMYKNERKVAESAGIHEEDFRLFAKVRMARGDSQR
jgi:hypothetical protein